MNFKKLSKLAREDPDAFKRERERLINEAIQSAPENKRENLQNFQTKIDKIMDAAGSKRQEVLSIMMQANVAELGRQLKELGNIIKNAQ